MRLGLVIPSSNVVLEPLAATLQGHQRDLTVHVSRLGVLDVRLDAASQAQFELDAQVAAARLLTDAKVERIVWGGTSASWLGIERDEAFAARVFAETGIPTTTTVLEINRHLIALGARRIGMVTPYTNDVAEQINSTYRGLGFEIAASCNDGGDMSLDFAAIAPGTIVEMIRNVASAAPDAVVIMCTNVAGAAVAADLAPQLDLPILDSAVFTLPLGDTIVT
ncbi:MAG: Asp/Glu/hydantoin racemase [Pseudomonadota bacterium]